MPRVTILIALFLSILFVGCGSPKISNINYKPDQILAKIEGDPNRGVYVAGSQENDSQAKAISGGKDEDRNFSYGNYYALIIGINNYRSIGKLKSAVNDATVIASILREKYGYKVEMLIDCTRNEIIEALVDFRKKLTNKDNLLIYYSGHGILDKDADEGYWLPVDATKNSESNWISNTSLTSSIRAMQAKHVLIVSDSCYSGKIMRSVNVSIGVGDTLKRLSEKRARIVMTSGGLEPVLDSGGADNQSVFSSAFIRALNENNGIESGTEIFAKVRNSVIRNSDQTPEYADIHKAGHDGGDFIFCVLPK
jgi:hypothetical protein